MSEWMNEVRMKCPNCDAIMEYLRIGVEADHFKCQCGFEISVGEDFMEAIVVNEEASCT